MATPATPRIDWRKLLLPFVFLMILPSVSAIVLDFWLGSYPLITIAAVSICFPVSTFLGIRRLLKEMDRVIAEVAPPPVQETEPEAESS